MLIECALADAYCIPFEFVENTPDRPNDLMTYHKHPTYDDLIVGQYTDDTQRTLANASAMLYGDNLFSPLTYARSYLETFASDPRAGYSRRYEAFLRESVAAKLSPQQFCLKLVRKPTNGAVMGAAVLGYLPTPEEVMLAAAAQAISTHSYATIPYAQIVALSAHYFLHAKNAEKRCLIDYLYIHLHESSKAIKELLNAPETENPPIDKISMGASSAVKLMLWAIPRYNKLSDLMKLAVDIGGDTDSAAAIMVAVASCSPEYEFDIAESLIQNLEPHTNGASRYRLFQMEDILRLKYLAITEAEKTFIEWVDATSFLSSTQSIVGHPLFYKFVQQDDITPVVDRIKRGEGSIQHFEALQNYYGNVITMAPEDRGNIPMIRREWARWLVDNGH